MIKSNLLLKPRLQAVFDLLKPCGILCDIGTDHAYIPIAALQQAIAGRAIACDIHMPPLRAAEKNIRTNSLADHIECRQGAGFTPLNEDEIGQVVIAGMGGLTIRMILSEGIGKAKKAVRLVMQPNNHISEVRQWLGDHGFTIEEEVVVQEKELYYQAFAAVYTGQTEALSNLELNYGRLNLQRYDAVVLSLLQHDATIMRKALAGMQQAHRDVGEQTKAVELQLQAIRQILRESI